MCELLIEKAMMIDEVELAKAKLEVYSGKKIQDMESVKRFICSEKNTKFYIDKKMRSSLTNDIDHTYVWLDTGFRDRNNNALFVSLLNNGRGYAGHIIGTARELAESIKSFYPKYKKDICSNYSRFVSKYSQKCQEREHTYIADEEQYLLARVNKDGVCENEFGNKIRQLNISWEKEEETIENEAPETVEKQEELNEQEKEITIGLLFDMLQEREQFIEELLQTIERSKAKSDSEIQDLVEIIRQQSTVIQEQTDALRNIRTFTDEEKEIQYHRDMKKEERQKGKVGHNLLHGRKKIMVLGTTNLSPEVMKGIITKEYGFEESDFVFENDYDKVVHSSGRVIESSRYQAIIFGCCPHSTTGKGKWSSLIERCKQSEDAAVVADARTESGNLKVTKGSFRKALNEICEGLSDVALSYFCFSS